MIISDGGMCCIMVNSLFFYFRQYYATYGQYLIQSGFLVSQAFTLHIVILNGIRVIFRRS